MLSFLTREEKADKQANFNDQAKFGMFHEALKSDLLLLQFMLFRGAKDYEELKSYYADDTVNQKMMSDPVFLIRCLLSDILDAETAPITVIDCG